MQGMLSNPDQFYFSDYIPVMLSIHFRISRLLHKTQRLVAVEWLKLLLRIWEFTTFYGLRKFITVFTKAR